MTGVLNNRQMNILLVDDEPLNRMFVEFMLEPLGYRVSFAENGRKGVDAWVVEMFDVILMDIQMPVLDGASAISEIRTLELKMGRERTPIAIFSSIIGLDIDALAEACSADSYISKPASMDTLLDGMSAAYVHAQAFANYSLAKRASGR